MIPRRLPGFWWRFAVCGVLYLGVMGVGLVVAASAGVVDHSVSTGQLCVPIGDPGVHCEVSGVVSTAMRGVLGLGAVFVLLGGAMPGIVAALALRGLGAPEDLVPVLAPAMCWLAWTWLLAWTWSMHVRHRL